MVQSAVLRNLQRRCRDLRVTRAAAPGTRLARISGKSIAEDGIMSMVNKVKSLGARAVMGDSDVRALLEKDHDEARELAQQMCEANGQRRRALLGRLKPILTAHSRAEERAVYGALLQVRKQEPDTLAQEGFVEHGLVDELLAKLAALEPANDVWLAHAKVLRELLEHHIDEEQTDTFAELGNHFTREELVAMGERFTREKAAILRGTAATQQRKTPVRAPARAAKSRKTAASKRAQSPRRASSAKTRSSATPRKSARAKR
jgi:hypothetical protein